MKIPGCHGLTLWRGKIRIELWICRQSVTSHRHPGQRVEVMPIWGRALFWRQEIKTSLAEHAGIRPGTWFKWLTIPAGWFHGFHLWKGPLIFLNMTYDGRSAADNFVK